MKRLEQLKQIADESLAGLEAGPELRSRILAQSKPARRSVPVRRWVAVAVSFALVLAVGIPVALNGSLGRHASGGDDGIAPMSVSHLGGDQTAHERASLDTDKAVLTVTKNNVSRAQGIFGKALVRIDNRYYQILNGISVSESCLIPSGMMVSETTGDITLSSGQVVSNSIPVGTEILNVRDMAATLVACRVNGALQVYQRISHAGTSRVGGERDLGDVLQLRGHVRAISLSDVGIVEGGEAERLFGVLLDSAEFIGSNFDRGNQVLIIELDNGAAVQLWVSGTRVSACGVWDCQDFFDQFPER